MLKTFWQIPRRSIFNLVQNRGGGDYVPIKQVVINALDKIEKASKQKGSVTGIATGFVDLDYQMAGLQPSDLILIAARPSMGKTAVCIKYRTVCSHSFPADHSNILSGNE